MKYRDKEFGVRASEISSQSGVRAGVDGTVVGALAGACSERLVPCAGTGVVLVLVLVLVLATYQHSRLVKADELPTIKIMRRE